MRPTTEKVYVKVNVDVDVTGYMCPRSCFKIESVRNFRPSSAVVKGRTGDCYTVVIHGAERLLFFEKTDSVFSSSFGRWFVERPVSEEC